MKQTSGGIGTARAGVSSALGAPFGNLVLTSTDGLIGTGNDLDTHLVGAVCDDVLVGRWGADTLDGGAGADVLIGGMDDDRDARDVAGNPVFERGGAGADTVLASVATGWRRMPKP